mgnify:CR=1 FL=1
MKGRNGHRTHDLRCGPRHCGDRFAATLQSERARWAAVVRATGMAALIATHNLDLAARMDRILHLGAGRIA